MTCCRTFFTTPKICAHLIFCWYVFGCDFFVNCNSLYTSREFLNPVIRPLLETSCWWTSFWQYWFLACFIRPCFIDKFKFFNFYSKYFMRIYFLIEIVIFFFVIQSNFCWVFQFIKQYCRWSTVNMFSFWNSLCKTWKLFFKQS